jgi:hypothetical protein
MITDDTTDTDEAQKQAMKEKKRRELKEQLQKSKQLGDKDKPLKSM